MATKMINETGWHYGEQDHRLRDDPASFDVSRGLFRHDIFRRRAQEIVNSARGRHENWALLLVGLDRMKLINEIVGHEAGDQLLNVISQRLHARVRSTDLLARLGSDEFCLLLCGVSRHDHLEGIAESILASIAEPVILGEHSIHPSASIGISVYPRHGTDLSMLMGHADTALASAKMRGGGRYELYQSAMSTHLQARWNLELEVRRACAESRFEVYFQPLVGLGSGHIEGSEALLRWPDSPEPDIPIGDVITILEDTGLIQDVGEGVLREACRRTRAWQLQTGRSLRVNVNLSPRQFESPDLPVRIAKVLEDTGLPPDSLDLEITESLLLDHGEQALDILARIKALGANLWIDDFGTGFSSLAYLQHFPIDGLKIDRRFIADLPDKGSGRAITLAIIDLGCHLGLSVLPEGVENEAQAEFLLKNGCTSGQGFYFSRPVSAEQFSKLLGL